MNLSIPASITALRIVSLVCSAATNSESSFVIFSLNVPRISYSQSHCHFTSFSMVGKIRIWFFVVGSIEFGRLFGVSRVREAVLHCQREGGMRIEK